MALSSREKAVALIASGISAYAAYQEKNLLPEGLSMIDFILKGVPESARQDVTIDLIDEVFVYASAAHIHK